MPTVKLRDVLESFAKTTKQKRVLLEMEDAGLMPAADAVMDAPAEGDDADKQAKAAFEQMIVAAFNDDALDMKGTLDRIKQILKAYYDVMGVDEAPVVEGDGESAAEEEKPEEEKPDEESGMESRRVAELSAELSLLRREKRARELCESAGIVPDAVLVESLVALGSDARMKALIDREKSRLQEAGKTSPRVRSVERAAPAATSADFESIYKSVMDRLATPAV